MASPRGSVNTDQYIAFPLGRENKSIFALGREALVTSVRRTYIDLCLAMSFGELKR